MKVANGLAYGTFRGYSAAFWDGSGTKTMMLSTSIRDVDAKSEFFSRLGQVNYQKEYRVKELTTMDDGIVVVFNDTVGTLKKMDEFFNFFFPILDACGATKADVCSCCGQPSTARRAGCSSTTRREAAPEPAASASRATRAAKRPRRRRTTPAITAWVFWAHSLARCSARSSGR